MATISKETAKTLADTIGMVKLVGEVNAKIQPQYKKMFEGESWRRPAIRRPWPACSSSPRRRRPSTRCS
jgi:hypothetical protein